MESTSAPPDDGADELLLLLAELLLAETDFCPANILVHDPCRFIVLKMVGPTGFVVDVAFDALLVALPEPPLPTRMARLL